ncbi:hypothetical protein D3C75_195350 [compost metagenome]
MLELDDMSVDALTDMLKASFSLDNWTAMIEIADKLFGTIAVIHATKSHGFDACRPRRSSAYYFGFSLCAKGIALQKLGYYLEAKECIQRYADLSWLKLEDEDALAEMEYYQNTAAANSFVIELLLGNRTVLPEYVWFIKKNGKEELLAGLITILESALNHNYSVDWALEELQSDVELIKDNESRENIRYYIDYILLLSIYMFKRGKSSDAVNLTLENIVLSGNLRDETGFKKATAFYELIRADADASQQQEYHYIMKKIIEREFNDEKEAFVIDHRIAD